MYRAAALGRGVTVSAGGRVRDDVDTLYAVFSWVVPG